MTVHFVTNEKIAETSSKGNQEKWFDKDTNKWYKLDQFGYEALAETYISQLLERSNIEKETPFTFVRYQMERLNVHKRERTGCSSDNFLKDGQSIIILSHLLGRMVDALFLNDDRHLKNIAVLEKDGKYDYCPIFDNGAGLLSDTRTSPFDISPKNIISLLKAKPFNMNFIRQRNTVEALYGKQIEIAKVTKNKIIDDLKPLLEYYPGRDRGYIADRVTECILLRQKK